MNSSKKKNKLIEGSLYDVNKQIIMPYKIEPWGKNILLDIKDHNKMDVIKETVMKTDQVNIIADYEAQSASIKGKIKESKENKKEKIGRFSDIVQIDRGLDKNYASLSAYKKLNKNQVKLGKGDKYLFKDKLPVVQHKTKKPPKTNIEQTRPTPNPKIAPLFKAINTISSKKELTLQKENFSDTTTLLDDNVGIIEENILPQPPEGDDFSKYTSNN